MSDKPKTKEALSAGATSAVFIKFAEVPEGVQIVSSSDAGVRRLKQTTFPNYDAGCSEMATRMGNRAHPPSSLVCELVH